MKNCISVLCYAAVSLAASGFISCNKIEPVLPIDSPEPPIVYTMKVDAAKVTTKALSLSGSSVAATWTEGDKIEVWTADGTTTKYGTLSAESGGMASTTFTGELNSVPGNGETLLLKYQSPDYTAQNGTLTGTSKSIDNVCDYALATVTATVNGTTVTATDADFESQQAIVRIQLFHKDGGATLVAKKLILQFAGETCTITPSTPTDVFFVAMPCVEDDWTPFVIMASEQGTDAYYEISAEMPLKKGEYFTADASANPISLSRIKTRINKGTDCRKYVGWEVYPNGNIAPKGENPSDRIGYIAYVSSSAVDHDFPDSRIFVLASSDVSYGGTDNFIWGHRDVYRDIAAGHHNFNPYDYPAIDDYGYDNTNFLQAYGFEEHPAAYVAWNYGAGRPEGASRWFLPAYIQIERLVGGDGTNISAPADFFSKMDFNLRRYYSSSLDGYWTSSESSIFDSPSFPELKGWAYYLSTQNKYHWYLEDDVKDPSFTYRSVRAAFVY